MARMVWDRLLQAEAADGFSQGEGPGARICLVCLKNSKEVKWIGGMEGVAGRGIEPEAREVKGMGLVGPLGPWSGPGPSLK